MVSWNVIYEIVDAEISRKEKENLQTFRLTFHSFARVFRELRSADSCKIPYVSTLEFGVLSMPRRMCKSSAFRTTVEVQRNVSQIKIFPFSQISAIIACLILHKSCSPCNFSCDKTDKEYSRNYCLIFLKCNFGNEIIFKMYE